MANSFPFVALNASAVSQQDRADGAPAPEAVQVDGRSLAQLLAFAARYGALINFYDLENQIDGDWASFFAGDPAVANALHASLDLVGIEQLFAELVDGFRQEHGGRRRARDLKQLLDALGALVQVLDRTHLVRGRAAAPAGGLDARARRDALAAPLGRLRDHLGRPGVADELNDRRWGERGGWSATLADILDDVVASLLEELKQGVEDAEQALQASLKASGHAPQAALYNAFVLLFMQARETLNQFPRRLVNFYYEQVLRQDNLAAVPDELFLTFTVNTSDAPGSVPRQALFSAGTDAANQAINYMAATALQVSTAVVESLSVHRVVFDKTGDGHTTPIGVLKGEIPVDPANPTAAGAFPAFGATVAGVHGALDLKPANLGFTVSTPVLLARGGERTVTISLVVSAQPTVEASDALQAHLAIPAGSITGLAATVAALIGDYFQLYYSTAGGWVAVDSFTVTPSTSSDPATPITFALVFVLPDDAPAIAPLSARPDPTAPAPDRPATDFPGHADEPTVVASVKPKPPPPPPPPRAAMFAAAPPPLNPFPVLQGVIVQDVIVDVAVRDLDTLTVTTVSGPVDTSHAFAPLGMPPVQFGGFDVYAPELFAKALSTLSLSITWSGLPISGTGFAGYYQGYVIDGDGQPAKAPLFDNTSFNVAFKVKNPGLWDVSGAAAPLFSTAIPAMPPPSGTIWPQPAAAAPLERISVLKPTITNPVAVAPAYYNPTASALRVSLTTPDYAFGNVLFTPNMLAAAAKQTAAAAAAAAKSGGGGAAQIASLAAANATAPDKGFAEAVAPAVGQAVSALTGDALGAVNLAIGASGIPIAGQAALVSDLNLALSVAPEAVSVWKRITGSVMDPAAVLDGLEGWLKQHEPQFGPAAQGALAKAHAALAAGKAIATAHAASVSQAPAVARPSIAAAVAQAAATAQPPAPAPMAMPNPPWLPMASAISVSYAASTRATGHSAAAGALGLTADDEPSAAVTPPPAFTHIGPFGKTRATKPANAGVQGLVPAVEQHAALYIQLSAQTEQISLLFVLAAGPNGWWDQQPELRWEQYVDGGWSHLHPLGDSTNNLANSGVVTLALATGARVNAKPRLRVLALGAADNAPNVQAVIANAVPASWVGPGGAGSLGVPLPAGTITKSLTPLTNIGAVAQPMESFGGQPALDGPPFQMWMAERLRHKGFGVDGWDYARLALEAAPTLWQAIVVPALDEQTGAPAAGKVWVVAVAGPKTPNVADPTVPSVDFTALSAIGEQLQGVISPFIQLAVTNPPYVRYQVTATCDFSPDDTPAYWEARLQDELVRWLSPWPPTGLGQRPADYYTERAVAEFMRGRPYVIGLTSFAYAPETAPTGPGFHYVTSSLTHKLSGAPPPTTTGADQSDLLVRAST